MLMKLTKILVPFGLGSMLMTIVVRVNSQKRKKKSFNAYWKYNRCFLKTDVYKVIYKSLCGTLSCRKVKTMSCSWTLGIYDSISVTSASFLFHPIV